MRAHTSSPSNPDLHSTTLPYFILQDIKDILPGFLILIIGLAVMVTNTERQTLASNPDPGHPLRLQLSVQTVRCGEADEQGGLWPL